MKPAILITLAVAASALPGQQPALPAGTSECFELESQSERFFQQGLYGPAEVLLRRGISCEERLLPAGHPQLATSYFRLGELTLLRRSFEDAEGLIRTALAIWSLQAESQGEHLALAYNKLAHVYYDQRRYYEAEPWARKAKTLAETASGAGSEGVAIALNTLGSLHAALKDPEGAEREFRRALAVQTAAGRRNFYTSNLLHNLATIRLDRGFPREAEELYRESLHMQEEWFGQEHPQMARTLEAYAKAVKKNGRKVEARGLTRRAHALTAAGTVASVP